jgi:hypothetical protein
MYHDQGLPVLKYASFGEGVNVTLGLPFVRTSVDHGTALDIAGTGRADPGSLIEAVKACHPARIARVKRFGQHFLHEKGVLEKLVDAIQPAPTDFIVEIGPGEGALTEYLKGVQALHLIELDRDLAARLAEQFPHATIHGRQRAGVRLRAIPCRHAHRRHLPYNVSTPLLFHLARFAPQVRDMHFMLQLEVVDRMVAAPSTPAYGRLSVFSANQIPDEEAVQGCEGRFPPAAEGRVRGGCACSRSTGSFRSTRPAAPRILSAAQDAEERLAGSGLRSRGHRPEAAAGEPLAEDYARLSMNSIL